jgi:hypothetical protein
LRRQKVADGSEEGFEVAGMSVETRRRRLIAKEGLMRVKMEKR